MKIEDQILAVHYTWKATTDHSYLLVYIEVFQSKLGCALFLYAKNT